jgi:hypothetical protein
MILRFDSGFMNLISDTFSLLIAVKRLENWSFIRYSSFFGLKATEIVFCLFAVELF